MELDRPLMYFLDESGEPVGIEHLDAFSDSRFRDWYEQRWQPGLRSVRIAQNDVNNYWVSTVFLSIDQQVFDGPPVLWETEVFGKKPPTYGLYCERYTSREDALQGHARVVAALLAGKTPEQLQRMRVR